MRRYSAVCGRAHRCVNETGECLAVSSLNEPDHFAAFMLDAADPMFPFGNNHGGAVQVDSIKTRVETAPGFSSALKPIIG